MFESILWFYDWLVSPLKRLFNSNKVYIDKKTKILMILIFILHWHIWAYLLAYVLVTYFLEKIYFKKTYDIVYKVFPPYFYFYKIL